MLCTIYADIFKQDFTFSDPIYCVDILFKDLTAPKQESRLLDNVLSYYHLIVYF